MGNVEDIKNIEDVSETLYKFLQTDIAKNMENDELMNFLENTDLNLFSSYTKLQGNEQNISEILSIYKLMENSYQEYVEKYCEGDKAQVDESKYTQYFAKAINYEEKIGQEGFIKTIQAVLQQNDLNRNFYSEYGHENTLETKEIGTWSRMKETIKTFIDRSRMSEYNDLIQEIEDMQRQMEEKERQDETEK